MVLTLSTMLPLQHTATDFNLLDVMIQENVSLNGFKGTKGTKGNLVVFICNHSPFIIHLLEHFNLLADKLKPQGITTIAISSNDIDNYPQDGPNKCKLFVRNTKYLFPIYITLRKKSQRLMMRLVRLNFTYLMTKIMGYRGGYDPSRPQSGTPITGEYFKNATLNLINKKPISKNQFPSMGCSIKWK